MAERGLSKTNPGGWCVFVVLLVAVGCDSPGKAASEPSRAATRRSSAVRATADGRGDLRLPAGESFPATVRFETDSITVARSFEGRPTRYLTFERDGVRTAYGVYALAGPKNGIPVPRPLRGEPVVWPDKDHTEALAHLLTLAGSSREEAERRVEELAPVCFAPGVRVLMVLPRPCPAGLGSPGDAGAAVVLIVEPAE